MDINHIKCMKWMTFSLHVTKILVMNPIHIRANVTCAILPPLNSGKQLEPERLHMRPSYTKSSGDLFSLWGKEKKRKNNMNVSELQKSFHLRLVSKYIKSRITY